MNSTSYTNDVFNKFKMERWKCKWFRKVWWSVFFIYLSFCINKTSRKARAQKKFVTLFNQAYQTSFSAQHMNGELLSVYDKYVDGSAFKWVCRVYILLIMVPLIVIVIYFAIPK